MAYIFLRQMFVGTLVALSALGALLTTVTPAIALTLVVTPTPTTGEPGQRLTFSATLTNNDALSVSLVGGGGNFGVSSVVWDDADFITNLPTTLSASESYTRSLFVDILVGTPLGTVNGDYSVQAENASNIPTEATAEVVVSVVPVVVVPETATGGMFLMAMAWVVPYLQRGRLGKKPERCLANGESG